MKTSNFRSCRLWWGYWCLKISSVSLWPEHQSTRFPSTQDLLPTTESIQLHLSNHDQYVKTVIGHNLYSDLGRHGKSLTINQLTTDRRISSWSLLSISDRKMVFMVWNLDHRRQHVSMDFVVCLIAIRGLTDVCVTLATKISIVFCHTSTCI